jgi:hypothetical protein
VLKFAALTGAAEASSKDKKNKATAPPALPTIKKVLERQYKTRCRKRRNAASRASSKTRLKPTFL